MKTKRDGRDRLVELLVEGKWRNAPEKYFHDSRGADLGKTGIVVSLAGIRPDIIDLGLEPV